MERRTPLVLVACSLASALHCGTPMTGGDASTPADTTAVPADSMTQPPRDSGAPPSQDSAVVPVMDAATTPAMDASVTPPGPDASAPRTDASVVADASAPRPDASPPGPEAGTMVPGDGGVPAGNPLGRCAIPAEAQLEDVSSPRTVVGTGTPASCTSDAFVNAVARGGVITFNCGPDPVTITLTRTAKIVNNTGPRIVIDGGNRVTLSGGGRVRILYMNTCDMAQMWTTPMCQNQDHPRLTVQNLTFIDGNSTGQTTDGGGGGAIYVRGGRFKIINSRFFNNRCEDTGPDIGGAAVRVLSQYNNQPVYVVNSTFGGAPGLGNVGSNGGGLSSIGVSYTVLNSVFRYNRAIGRGANPMRPGTPGGGSGGAIYNDGNNFTLTLCGTEITDNSAVEGGGAVFFVSNDRTGSLVIRDSVLRRNPSMGFETRGFPGIFVLAAPGNPMVSGSVIE